MRLQTETKVSGVRELIDAFINRDILYTQLTYLSAIREYIQQGGKSRGSYLIGERDLSRCAQQGIAVELDNGAFSGKVCEVALDVEKLQCSFSWEPVRPIPKGEDWFENVYNAFLRHEVIG